MTPHPVQAPTAFEEAVSRVRAGSTAGAEASSLYGLLTSQERLDLLDGDTPFWPGMAEMLIEGYNLRPLPMGSIDRLGIPGVRFVDGPRGVVVGHSTAFPVSMARGATWDVELEERVGEAIGLEARAQGGNFFAGVCINLPRHPAWGRVQETYGEDPVLLGELGAALVRGTQRNVMACVKHFALNSMENARFSVDVTADQATLHEFFLPHFRRVVDEGVCAVMSSYNSVNGEWGGQNQELLTTVLRDDWGFDGFVISDFIWGMRDGTTALRAGLDVEAPFRQQRGAHLVEDLEAGRASWGDVDRSGLRILTTQLDFIAHRDDAVPPVSIVASDAHLDLAREVAARSMVLLRNEAVEGTPILPLRADSLARVAVLGRLAGQPNTGDHGSSDVRARRVVTPLEGLRAALPRANVQHITEADPTAAVADADVAIVVVGYTAADEGEFLSGEFFTRPELLALYPEPQDHTEREIQRRLGESAADGLSVVGAGSAGGDRSDLHLRDEDVALIHAVAAANPRTIVAVVAGGAVMMEEWHEEVPGVLMAWYAGTVGGHALADVLLGAVDASGRLPFSVPSSVDHLPVFDGGATTVEYDRWFGQRLLDHLGVPAAYPLGFGLSYTSFGVRLLSAVRVDEVSLEVRAQVANTGARDGRHVVQVYGYALDGERFLLGFAAAAVAAGESVEVIIPSSLRPLGTWDADSRTLHVPQGPVRLEVGSYAGDSNAAIGEA
jgi:beta-glucosidase